MLTLPDSTLRVCRCLAVFLVTACRVVYGQTEGIQITNPDDGAVLFPNQTVAITIEPLGGVLLEDVLFLTRFSADLVDAPPFYSNLTIPAEAIGFINVTAYGRSSDGEFLSDEITIFVQPDGVLQELSVEPQRFLFFREGHQRQIVVRGHYDDGLTRDLTSGSTGTTYSSSSTNVVSVDEDGTMEARGRGSASVSVSNSGNAAEVAVVVDLIPTPVADAGPPQVVQCVGPDGALVTLDGSNSYDPDGNPLEFEWSVRGGAVLGTSPVIELLLSLGTHEAILTVDDGVDGASSDAVVITVQDAVPPTIDSLTATPNVLRPPNHKIVPISISASASDICAASPVCKITSVSSSEPTDGLGDGDIAPDWEILGPLMVNLRAERSGNRGGRTYTMEVTCTDAAGNSTTKSVDVTVPHDQRKGKK